VHAGVAEINVHKIGAVPLQQRIERLIFTAVNDRRPSLDEFEPAVNQQIGASFWNNFDVIKRKPLCILNFFRDDKGLDPAQSFYLPVNVPHLRLQKAGAIARYNPPTHSNAGSFVRLRGIVHVKFRKEGHARR